MVLPMIASGSPVFNLLSAHKHPAILPISLWILEKAQPFFGRSDTLSMVYKTPKITVPNPISSTVEMAKESLAQHIPTKSCEPCIDSFSLVTLAQSGDIPSCPSIVARTSPSTLSASDAEFDDMLRTLNEMNPHWQEFDDLFHMAGEVRERYENLDIDWYSERNKFDSMDKPLYDVLRERMRDLAARTRNNPDVIDEYHLWSSDVDASIQQYLESDDNYERGSLISDIMLMLRVALQDLAREGRDSNAFYLLDALATRNNRFAIDDLGSVIEEHPAQDTQHTMSAENIELTMGTQRAVNKLAQTDEVRRRISFSISAYNVPDEDQKNLLSRIAHDTAASLAGADALIASGDIYYVRSLTHLMAMNEDSELVEEASRALMRAAVEDNSITALFLLSIFAEESECAADLMGSLEAENFFPLINLHRNHAIHYLREQCSMPTIEQALNTMPVAEDEDDTRYLRALARHGDNMAAAKRLLELSILTSAKIIPFKE